MDSTTLESTTSENTTAENLLSESSSFDPFPMIIGIIVAVVVLLVVIGVAGGIAFWLRRKKRTNGGSAEAYVFDIDSTAANEPNATSVEMYEAKKEELGATSSFIITDIEIQHQIGGGNFGDVYQGLWQDTTVVALKKLKGDEQLKEFEAEVNTLK